jgi:hypothetical protein
LPIPIKDNQWDAIGEEQIQLAIDEAEEYIMDYLDRRIASNYYTERVPGRDRPFLILEEYPITYLSSVYSHDMYGSTEYYDTGDIFVDADTGMLEWIDKSQNMFEKGKTYIVNYQAGYYPVPVTIKKALAYQSMEMLQPIFRKTNTTISMVDLIPNSTEMIVELLEKYRRKRIG